MSHSDSSITAESATFRRWVAAARRQRRPLFLSPLRDSSQDFLTERLIGLAGGAAWRGGHDGSPMNAHALDVGSERDMRAHEALLECRAHGIHGFKVEFLDVLHHREKAMDLLGGELVLLEEFQQLLECAL